ncbi:AMP-binding protein [Notoacmeibacter ruber]|uniref:3-methylmercaptopropionyl-CoA ligase n=1 Tax=Notoacmeibacter ruber TaxID=2670375 RepID=A0A3L7J4M2_9HYPH|nr:AMP-binding protein [Notoacmeibacter ruber]RLQ85265.1 long-chain fatty acid--CoA ligase [Notoacmeibacter ruber]
MNPAEWLARIARVTPDAPALFLGDKLVADYGAFSRDAAAIGAGLVARGIGPGDRVALFMPNSIDYLPIFYGILYAGATAVPVNGKLHAREAAWIVAHSDARLVFAKDPQALRATGDIAGVPCLAPGGEEMAALRATPPLAAPAPMQVEDPAWLFYTSGTTGRPKGAILSCGNLMAMSLSYFADVDEVAAGDAALYAAPLSHGAGLYNFVHVLRGARHVVPESGGFDPAEIFALAQTLGNVSMFAAPTMVKRMVDHARAGGGTGEGIKTIVYGGGPMYLADIKDALAVMGPKFVQIYGQGEAPMTITALSRADISDRDAPGWERRLASVGRAHAVAELRILDARGAPLPPGEAGEIAVRGPQVMQGYLENPEASAKSLRDGWLMTGDLGHLDNQGYLFLHDRAKDLVISGGSNIYPREVEEALLTHPGVSEVSVIGVPDTEWGEIVVAFVVPVGDGQPEMTELDDTCTSLIARFKKPKRYIFVPELPKNNYGKVLKTDLRARMQNGS